MLKRSKLLVAFLLVTVICASVGFASIADDLFVEGTMGINVGENSPADEEFEGDVYFVDGSTSVALSNGTGTVTATVTDQSATEVDDKITLNIPDTAWAKIGDTVTLTVKVKNENTSNANLSIALSEAADDAGVKMSDYVSVAFDANSATVATAGSETEIKIVFTIKALPATTTSGSYSVTLNATAVNPTN